MRSSRQPACALPNRAGHTADTRNQIRLSDGADVDTARRRLVLPRVLGLSGLVVHGGATASADLRAGVQQETYGGPPVVRSGFYEIGSFGGSSLSEDAQIYENRIQGVGTIYARVDRSRAEPELMVRADPRDTAPLVAYVDLWVSHDAFDGLSVFAADEEGLMGELEKASADDVGLLADRIRGRWAHVVYGYTRAGEARAGWVHLAAGRVMYVLVRPADSDETCLVRGSRRNRVLRSAEWHAGYLPDATGPHDLRAQLRTGGARHRTRLDQGSRQRAARDAGQSRRTRHALTHRVGAPPEREGTAADRVRRGRLLSMDPTRTVQVAMRALTGPLTSSGRSAGIPPR